MAHRTESVYGMKVYNLKCTSKHLLLILSPYFPLQIVLLQLLRCQIESVTDIVCFLSISKIFTSSYLSTVLEETISSWRIWPEIKVTSQNGGDENAYCKFNQKNILINCSLISFWFSIYCCYENLIFQSSQQYRLNCEKQYPENRRKVCT